MQLFRTSQRSTSVLIAFALTVIASISGCGVFGQRTPTNLEKGAILMVAGKHLDYIHDAKIHDFSGLVIWADYLANRGEILTKQQVFEQMKTVATRWPDDATNPLRGLSVEDISVRGDNAEVVLKKANQPTYPEVRVSLLWAGSGWLVTHDTVFGKSGLLASIP